MTTTLKIAIATTPAIPAAATTVAPTAVVNKPATPKKVAVRAKVVKVDQQPTTAQIKPVAVAKPAKVKKPKLVRDSFTIPKVEYTVLDELKLRAIDLAQPAKKSELLRAGIKALAAMSNASFQAALQAVPTIKTGRPAAVATPKPAAKKAVKKLVKKV